MTTENAAETTRESCCDGPDLSLPVDDVEADVAVLSALANRTRYGALRVLDAADGAVCSCEFVGPLDVSQSGVSHALTVLHDAGLVSRRKDGRWRYYSLTPRAERLLAALDAEREAVDEDGDAAAVEVTVDE